jgi:peptidoglycan/LPS O-acetylase OafA/YrhL
MCKAPHLLSRLPSLDGWRALCIFVVLGSHCTAVAGFPSALSPAFHWIFDGNLGVRMFFIISGFLITWLMLIEYDRSNRVSLRRFYARRALRILPVYFAFLSVLFLLQHFTAYRQSTAFWLANVTFTTNFAQGGNWTSGHLWSLAVEEQFYILWPCLFVVLGCGRSLKRCLWILALPICVAPLARVLSYLNATPLCLQPFFSHFSFLNYFDSLAIGCACAVLFSRRPQKINLLITTHPRLVSVIGLALIIVPYSLNVLLLLGIFTVPFGFTCEGFGLALLLLQSLTSTQLGLYQVLNLKGIRLVGTLSYSIYIWQQIFCTQHEAFGLGPVLWMSFPYWIIPALLVGSISYFGLERPFLRLRAHFRT